MKTFYISPNKKKRFPLKFFALMGKKFSSKWFSHLIEENVEIPKPKDTELLLKTLACGVCGTDIDKLLNPKKMKNNNTKLYQRPGKYYLGHEIVAKVIDAGSLADKSLIGKKVVIGDINVCKSFNISPECENCKKKRGIFCLNKNKRKFNEFSYGGFSEYLIRSEHQTLTIPNDIKTNTAIFIEPLSTALNCYRYCKKKNKVLINGLSTISILLYRVLINYKFSKDQIFFKVLNKFQKNKAQSLGINNFYESYNISSQSTNDFDITVDFKGKSQEIKTFINHSKPKSEILLFGIDNENLNLDFNQLIFKGLSVRGIHGYSSEYIDNEYVSDLDTAKNLIYQKKVIVDDLISEVDSISNTKYFLQKISLSASGLFNKNKKNIDYKFRSILTND